MAERGAALWQGTGDDFDIAPGGMARTLEDYWRSLLRGRRMPMRSDIEPTHLRAILPNIFLFDVDPEPLRFRWRLAGTTLVRHLRFEPTGHWLDETPIAPDDRILEACRLAVEERRPICHLASWRDARGRTLPLIRGILPLGDLIEGVSVLLGVADFAPAPATLGPSAA
jgi:hypothetical protein